MSSHSAVPWPLSSRATAAPLRTRGGAGRHRGMAAARAGDLGTASRKKGFAAPPCRPCLPGRVAGASPGLAWPRGGWLVRCGVRPASTAPPCVAAAGMGLTVHQSLPPHPTSPGVSRCAVPRRLLKGLRSQPRPAPPRSAAARTRAAATGWGRAPERQARQTREARRLFEFARYTSSVAPRPPSGPDGPDTPV